MKRSQYLTKHEMTKILIIEDRVDLLEELMEVLQYENYQVIKAVDGEEGVWMANQYLPDIILCDILMPRKNGFQVLADLKKNSKTRSIPFIFITAKTTRDVFETGSSHGVCDYLYKPFTRQEMLEALNSVAFVASRL